jgi:hypothetical protein
MKLITEIIFMMQLIYFKLLEPIWGLCMKLKFEYTDWRSDTDMKQVYTMCNNDGQITMLV